MVLMHELVILVAEYLIVASAVLVLGVWLDLSKTDKKRFIGLAIVGGIVTLVLAKLGSWLYYDPRPFVVGHYTPYFTHGADNGFPSDHTLLSSFFGFLVLSYRRKIGYVLLVMALLIGGARVIAGVHHTIDIIGAFACAGLGALVARFIVSKQRSRLKPLD